MPTSHPAGGPGRGFGDGLVGCRVVGLLGLLACLVLCGCKTVRYVPVETVRTDSVYVDRFMRDSVYVRDSVWVNRWTAGDTVFVDKVSVKWRYRDRWRRDTLRILRYDTVETPVPVERELGWWERARMKLFWPLVAVVVVLVIAVWWLARRRQG